MVTIKTKQGKNIEVVAVVRIAEEFAIGVTGVNYGINDSISNCTIVNGIITNSTTNKIYYGSKGAYIIKYGIRYYIDSFIKI